LAGGVFEFTFGLGRVDSSMPTPATAITVVYNSAMVLTCNGGSGASLVEAAFNSYSCGGGGGMNINGGGSSGSGGSKFELEKLLFHKFQSLKLCV